MKVARQRPHYGHRVGLDEMQLLVIQMCFGTIVPHYPTTTAEPRPTACPHHLPTLRKQHSTAVAFDVMFSANSWSSLHASQDHRGTQIVGILLVCMIDGFKASCRLRRHELVPKRGHDNRNLAGNSRPPCQNFLKNDACTHTHTESLRFGRASHADFWTSPDKDAFYAFTLVFCFIRHDCRAHTSHPLSTVDAD